MRHVCQSDTLTAERPAQSTPTVNDAVDSDSESGSELFKPPVDIRTEEDDSPDSTQ